MQPLLTGFEALQANPAGLASLQAIETGFHHESWAGSQYQDVLGVAVPMGASAGLGLQGFLSDLGGEAVYDTNGVLQGQRNRQRYGLALATGGRHGVFAGGVALRGYRRLSAQDDSFGAGADLGLAWSGPEGISAGLSATNLGSTASGSPAEALRWALGRRVYLSHGWLWPGLGYSWSPQGGRLHLGLEWRLDQVLDLRAGYQGAFGPGLFGGTEGWTLGIGSRLGSVSLDYAWAPLPGQTVGQRLSLTWQPSSRAAQAKPPADLAPPPLPESKLTISVLEDPLESAVRLEEAGKLEQALERYQVISEDHPNYLGAWRGLADLNYRLGRPQRAWAAFLQVQRLKPDRELGAWMSRYRQEALGSQGP